MLISEAYVDFYDGFDSFYNIFQLLDFKLARLQSTWCRHEIFRVAGPLWGESTGPWWNPLIKDSDAEHWCFLWCAPDKRLNKQCSCRWSGTPWCSCDVTLMKYMQWRHTGAIVSQIFRTSTLCSTACSILNRISKHHTNGPWIIIYTVSVRSGVLVPRRMFGAKLWNKPMLTYHQSSSKHEKLIQGSISQRRLQNFGHIVQASMS